MVDRIRIGVIGAHAERGWARWTHLPALLGLAEEYEVVAVAGSGRDSAEAAARTWGAGLVFDDAHALLAHPDVDLVTISVQLPRRTGLVEAAIAAGKHVYSEWPLAIDAATAQGFLDAAESRGVRHAVGLQSRHHPAIRYVRDLILEDHIGRLLSASLSFSLAAPETLPARYADIVDRSKGVNHLTIVGGHAMDMFRYMVGDFRDVSATLATRIPTVTVAETGEPLEATSPDQIAVVGTLNGGAVGSVHIMTGGPKGAGFRFELHGRAGRLILVSGDDNLVGPVFRVYHDDGTTPEPVGLDVPDGYAPALRDVPPAVANVHRVYADLAHAIRTGQPSEPSFRTAVGTHRLIDAIDASARDGARRPLG